MSSIRRNQSIRRLLVDEMKLLLENNSITKEEVIIELQFRKTKKSKALLKSLLKIDKFKSEKNIIDDDYLISNESNQMLINYIEPIAFSELSVKLKNVLRRAKILEYSQLKNISKKDILKLQGFGLTSLIELKNHLASMNKMLKNNLVLPKGKKIYLTKESSHADDVIFFSALSQRTRNALRHNNIFQYSQLKLMTENDLLQLRNFGAKSLNELISHLKDLNEHLKINKKNSEIDLIENKKKKFLQKGKGKKILEMWNNSSETLDSIAKQFSPPISRERVRQVLRRAEALGLNVQTKLEKSKIRKQNARKRLLNKYKSEFMNLYGKYTQAEVTKMLNISIIDYQFLQNHLMEKGLIEKKLYTPKEKNAGVKKRREIILKLVQSNMTNNEIANTLGVSAPTIYADLKEMRDQGMPIPPPKTMGMRVDPDEINYRTYFIDDKLKKGWTRERIGRALGFKDGTSVSRHIKKYML